MSIKIDVTKIDKARIHEGKKGKYLDLTTFIDTSNKDQYENNGFISQSLTKEEREQNIKTPILGNCKVFWTKESDAEKQAQAPAPAPAPHFPAAPGSDQSFNDEAIDDVPF